MLTQRRVAPLDLLVGLQTAGVGPRSDRPCSSRRRAGATRGQVVVLHRSSESRSACNAVRSCRSRDDQRRKTLDGRPQEQAAVVRSARGWQSDARPDSVNTSGRRSADAGTARKRARESAAERAPAGSRAPERAKSAAAEEGRPRRAIGRYGHALNRLTREDQRPARGGVKPRVGSRWFARPFRPAERPPRDSEQRTPWSTCSRRSTCDGVHLEHGRSSQDSSETRGRPSNGRGAIGGNSRSGAT